METFRLGKEKAPEWYIRAVWEGKIVRKNKREIEINGKIIADGDYIVRDNQGNLFAYDSQTYEETTL